MKKYLILFLVIVCLSFVLNGCVKYNKLPETEQPEAAPLIIEPPKPDITLEQMLDMEKYEAGSYLLGPGDTITISVYGEEGLTRIVTIEPSGEFTFPLIGEVEARGKRVAELVQELDKRLSRFIREATTDIIINKFSSNQYVVLGGGVKSTGTYTITGETRLLDAIARAGGFRTIESNQTEIPGADLARAYLSRGGKIMPIDFSKLVLTGDTRYNIRIRPKDIVYIPLLTSNEVFVYGGVNAPTIVPLLGRMTITKAIILSGGFTDNAKASKVMIVRNSKKEPIVYQVDVDAIFHGETKDIALSPGDIVYVPTSVF